MQSLTQIDDFIAYQAGTHIVKLTWTNHGVYTVKVSDGVSEVDTLGGTYDNEAEARLIARGYALMFKAEHAAKVATLDAYTVPGQRDFSAGRTHRKPPTPAELDLIRRAVRNDDGTFTVRTRPGQSWTVLKALNARIPGVVTVRPGTARVIDALTYTAEQLAPYLTSEEYAA